LTDLRVSLYELPAADLGPENPLPSFRGEKDDEDLKIAPSIPERYRRHLGWRTAARVLPYRMQDGYNRDKRLRSFRSAVLENEILRATFLPELGGRLVSLVHKPTERELLDCNPVFQPANFALRNAWFTGGIEWNVSHYGHHYLTCSPAFAARLSGVEREPVLRIYEWDRLKCFPWQVDFHLPPNSPFLFARVRLVNPHRYEIPMWWWTNVEVPGGPGVRMICPADMAIYHLTEGLSLTQLPELQGTDFTYPANADWARSFFLVIPDGRRPWIAALDGTGRGLVEVSTAKLRGRKLWVWGTKPGGRRWQEYLSVPGRAYFEIQAGLAPTQMECVPMPAGAQWTWTEAFGLLEADPGKIHSKLWAEAVEEADRALEAALPQAKLDLLDGELASVTVLPAEELLARGSGWGALERRRLAACGEEDLIPVELAFDDSSLGADQAPWLKLLETGVFPETDPMREPGHWMVQPEWEKLLCRSVEAGRSDHWLAWLHLGVMRMEARDLEGARAAWLQSLRRRPSAWALRNLSVLERRQGNPWVSLGLLRQAWDTGPRIAALAVEYTRDLLELERYDLLREFVSSLPGEISQHERVQINHATASLRTGHLEEVEMLFRRDFATIREGEVKLTDLWFEFHQRKIAAAENLPIDDALRNRIRKEFPAPLSIDFRMRPE